VRATARCLTVAISICAWIAISNHCAVGAIITKTNLSHSECPFHSKPAKQKDPDSQPCCKILRAVATTPAKSFAPAIVDLSWPKFVMLAPPKISVAPVALDTGPPGKTSFVELTASVRAHGPPLLA
jgi:hypothetical protein